MPQSYTLLYWLPTSNSPGFKKYLPALVPLGSSWSSGFSSTFGRHSEVFYSPHLEKTSITVDIAGQVEVSPTSSLCPKMSPKMPSRTSQTCPRFEGLEDGAWLDSGGHAEVFGLSLPFLYPSSPTGLDLAWLVGGQSSTVVPFPGKYSSNWVGRVFLYVIATGSRTGFVADVQPHKWSEGPGEPLKNCVLFF